MKKLSFYSKIFIAFMGLAVVPLVIHVLYFSYGLKHSDSFLREKAAEALDGQTEFMLMQTANAAAERVSMFLESVLGDVETLTLAEPSFQTFQNFYNMNQASIRETVNGVETRHSEPLYKEIAFADADGNELIRLRDGLPAPLRDVSDPKNTEFRTEDYFGKCIDAKDDEMYVSRLTGLHVKQTEGREYGGVFRFCKKVSENGRLKGILIVSLNQKHLNELISHIDPTGGFKSEIPYTSGNYGFIFDDEGWMIAHPIKADIRGLDAEGRLLPPFSKENNVHGEYPFNLLYAGFVHKNYPAAASAVRMGGAGVTDVTNVGGIKKMMAYAPINFPHGEFSRHGIFGGVAIGAEASQFHQAADVTTDAIRFEFKSYITRSWMFVSAVLLIAVYVSIRMAGGVVRPINILSAATKEMADGRLTARAEIDSDDEIGQLAKSFNTMAKSLNEQRTYLENSLEELEKSRRDIMWEQVFKTTVFENIDTGIVTVDRDGYVTFMNAPARDIFEILVFEEGLTLDALTDGCPSMKSLFADNSERLAGEYITAEKEDGQRTYRVSRIPLRLGSYDGTILTVEDVTEQISLREQIERMERLASLGRLSAGMAHEIRNPLTGVSLLLDDLHDGLIGRTDEQMLIRRALSEIERLEKLVNELLSFARVPVMNLKSDSIVPIIEDTVGLLKRQHPQINFITEYAESLPDMSMDKDKLKQALLNLIKNGAEAMINGGNLTVSVTHDDKNAYIAVRDTGEGIPDDRIPLIFEPFFTKKQGGTGLGLSITHNIITDHHGKISVKSIVGQGTEFTVTLPLK